jgi:hypothetical protein
MTMLGRAWLVGIVSGSSCGVPGAAAAPDPLDAQAVTVAEGLHGGGIAAAERNRIVLGTTAVGVAGVTLWGVAQWDYFSRTPHAHSEGWFGENTDDGGMDKLGHMYASYVMSHGIACLYKHWDFDRRDAALFGSLTSFAIMGCMELGDSFSDYGFSAEDMTMNTLGCLMGYVLYLHPALASKVDFRWQVGLDPGQADFFTDYSNSKFLFALKLNGFERTRKTWLRHVELHAGYYTEGFGEESELNCRHPYLGIGFNFTDLFQRHGHGKTAAVFRYVQPPYTTLNYDFDL